MTTDLVKTSWQCGCVLNGVPITHCTGTYCGACGRYAPGCEPSPPKDVRDVELASLRSAWRAQKQQTDELREMLRKLFADGYRIKGSFGEMLDNPEFRKTFADMLKGAE